MNLLKAIAALLGVVVIYGIVGRLDYEDAMREVRVAAQLRLVCESDPSDAPATVRLARHIDDPAPPAVLRCLVLSS